MSHLSMGLNPTTPVANLVKTPHIGLNPSVDLIDSTLTQSFVLFSVQALTMIKPYSTVSGRETPSWYRKLIA